MIRRIQSKYIVAIALLFCGISKVLAQKTEIGILVGGSYYYGDIVNDFNQFSSIHGAGGLYLRYHITENLAVKGFAGYCRVGAADSVNSTSSYQKNRNLSFWSDILEGSVQLEYSFVKDITRGRRLRNRFIPYVFAGLGAFNFTSWANYTNTSGMTSAVKLEGLQTEGKAYTPIAICLPFGIGFRYKITSNWNAGFELGVRYTTTSYIDDIGGATAKYPNIAAVKYEAGKALTFRSKNRSFESDNMGVPEGSLRGKIAISDLYMIYGLTIGYRMGVSGGGGGGYGGRAIRCPRFY